MIVVAWRGNSCEYLENTLESVVTVPDNIKWIEIDTRLTRDNKLVAYHSPTMTVHGDPRNISDIDYIELETKIIHSRSLQYKVPLVEQLIDTVDKNFLLHVKRETSASAYAHAVASLPRPCYFHSNSEPHLKVLAGNKNVIGLYKSIYSVPRNRKILDYVTGYMLGHRAFMPVSALEPDWIRELKSRSMHLLVFAGSTEEWISEVCGYNVDGFLTNRFDRAHRVLNSLGVQLTHYVYKDPCALGYE